MIGSGESYKFLSDLVSKQPKVVVIVDHKDRRIKEGCEDSKSSPRIIRFKTFVRENAPSVHAHLVESLQLTERCQKKDEKEEEKEGRIMPDHHKSWEKRLEWVDENVRELAQILTKRILELNDVTHKPGGSLDYSFFRSKPTPRSNFAILLLNKKELKIRIRADPATLKDPKKWVREKVLHWFMYTGKGVEKDFKITEKNQIDYAMELIKQSYELAE